MHPELKGNEQKSSGHNHTQKVINILTFILQGISEISLQLEKAVWWAEEMAQRIRDMTVYKS